MAVDVTQRDIEELRTKGYSDEQIQEAINQAEQEELNKSYGYAQQQFMNDPRQHSQMSAFASKIDENLIRWQLELNDILERAEHILKGDVPKFENGHIIWEENKNPDNNCLNNYGIQEVLKILSMYINRNTILSDYDNKEINFKVFDFGIELNNLIYMRYEDFGMNTTEKRKNYPMIVRQLIDIVHSAYKRAREGGERRSLREMISVLQSTSTQSQVSNGVSVNSEGMPMKERGLLNPLRYVKGKYA